jgi:hypothetical protein
MIPNLQLKNLLNLQNKSKTITNLIPQDLLNDNYTPDQNKNLMNFILAISLALGSITLAISYLNYQKKNQLAEINKELNSIFEVTEARISTKETYQERINTLYKIKEVSGQKRNFSNFFNDIYEILNFSKNENLVSLKYEYLDKTRVSFVLIVNSQKSTLFDEIRSLTQMKTELSEVTLLNKIKLEGGAGYQYEIKGLYGSR